MMNFDIARSEIAKEYCRSILVVDDEIFEGKDGGPLRKHYKKFFDSCESEGVLCHMHQYNAQSALDDTAIKKVSKLAKKSDIIILDWLLWHSDPEKKENSGSSETTIEVLTQLTDLEELKFIFIYTNITDINTVVHTIKNEISEELQNITERISGNQPKGIKDPQYFSINKLFIGIHHKKEAAEEDSAHLLELVQELLKVSYSDYLHWAGLELSTRIRDLIPKIIASLPEDTNGPMLYQYLFQEGDNEISEQISEVILDELRMMFIHKPLQISCDSVLQNYLESSFPQELIGSKTKTKKNLKKRTEKLTEVLLYKETPNCKDEDKLEMSTHLETLNSNINGFINIDSHVKWANLKESLLFNLHLETNKVIWPGYIYANKKSKNPQSYLLCITPACDCYRPGGKKLFFLIGSKSKEENSRMSHTKTVTNNQTINWDPTRIQSLTLKQVSDKYEIVGALRKDFVNRIIQRVWNHQTRVGVDSSELLRRIRKE